MFFKKVNRQPQKTVFYILCGPLFWIVSLAFMAFDFIAQKLFGPFYDWLTKE